MAQEIIVNLVLSVLLISSYTHVVTSEEGFISVDISQKGLDFVKDLLIRRAETSLVPLELPQIERSAKIPVIGTVDMVLSNISLYEVRVNSSTVKAGDTGLVIVASGATANLSMDWRYSYHTWLVPISISDKGSASVQVEGMEVGLTLALENQRGTLNLSILECGCYVKDVSIKLGGGASWLYQGLVDAFEGKISSAVEDAVSNKIKDGTIKLDSLLQSLPKEVPIGDISAINVTFVNNPVLSNSSVSLEIDGLFTGRDHLVAFDQYDKYLQASLSCKDPSKMVGISVHENVLNSASLVYFNAHTMHWIVDKVPDQNLLNTAGWKYIVPKLYKLYPDDDINLNISATSPPIIKIEKDNIDATVHLDLVINVMDTGVIVPVACISLEISASGSADISWNGLAGRINLEHITMSLEWSTIGNLHMHLIQGVVSTLLKTVILPFVNLQLWKGLPLPVVHGYTLSDAEVLLTDSRVLICSNVAPVKQASFSQL